MRIKAIFDVDSRKLLKESEMREGEELAAFERECGWLEESGVYLINYEEAEETK